MNSTLASYLLQKEIHPCSAHTIKVACLGVASLDFESAPYINQPTIGKTCINLYNEKNMLYGMNCYQTSMKLWEVHSGRN